MAVSENLKRQVMREAGNLRRHASQEEINKLNLKGLDPTDAESCVYGQMTGDCYGNRASQLIAKCAVPVVGKMEFKATNSGYVVDENVTKLLPTSMWKHGAWRTRIGKASSTESKATQHTALEYYITQKGAKLGNLIRYLKGKTDVLFL